MNYLQVYNKDLQRTGILVDAIDVERRRRINSDYELVFTLPMASDNFALAQPKGHVKDDKGQYYVINDRSRKREGVKRLVQYDCMHVMFKLADFKFPYASYVEESFGVSISTLLTLISNATGGKFTFSVDDSFDLRDIKDFGRGNCLEALHFVLDRYGAEVNPDNFVLHIRKKIGQDRGFQARAKKNIININFKDSSRTLVTRMFSQMKDGLSFIGLPASNLTAGEYTLLNAVPGAIVGGEIKVNYLISPYAASWANTTNTYYDGEIIKQDIEDQLELLEATRIALAEMEVPALDVPLTVADLNRLDNAEPIVDLGDTIRIFDPDMEVNNISARVIELREPLFDPEKQPEFVLANYNMRDYNDIIADLNKSKQIFDDIMSGGRVRASVFEEFARQAVVDVDNSKSQIIYDDRGIVLQSTSNPLHQVVASSGGIYVTQNGGLTALAAITAAGVVAERVVGKLGNFIEIEIGTLNNVFKANANGIHLGHADFGSSPFRVTPAGAAFASNLTVQGGVITGPFIQTAAAGIYPRIEINSSTNEVTAYQSAANYARMAANDSGTALIKLSGSNGAAFAYLSINSLRGSFDIRSKDAIYITPDSGDIHIPSWSKLRNVASGQNLDTVLAGKASSSANTSSITGGDHNHSIADGTRLAVWGAGNTVSGYVTYSEYSGWTHSHAQNA